MTGDGSYELRLVPGQNPKAVTVSFAIHQPADDYEATLRLWLHRDSWRSQGSPGRLRITMNQDRTIDKPAGRIRTDE